MEEEFTFEDGVILCNHIYQNAINKTLNGVIEQEKIFYEVYEILKKIRNNFDYERLDELLYLLNMENVSCLIKKE